MNAAERPRVWTDVSALMALCAGLRLAFVWLVPRTLDSADAVAYLETARAFAEGNFTAADPKIPVLYPLLVALAHQIIPDTESAARAVSWVFSTLLVAPVFLLAFALHGRDVARVAGVLIAFWPWLIDYSSRVATEPLAVFLFVCGVYALIRGYQDARIVRFAAAGAAFGLLHLARPEGTFIYLAALASVFIYGVQRIERPIPKLLAYAAPGLVAIAAGLIFTHAAAGVWSINYRIGFIGDQPEGSTVLRDLARTLVRMTADVPAVMLGPLLWAFFGVGVVLRTTRERDPRAESAVLYFAALQWLVVLPVISPAPRYLMSALVICAIWSARGIERAAALLAKSARPSLVHAPIAVVVGWMCFHSAAQVASYRMDDENRPAQPWEYKISGEWMKEHLDPGVILTRKPQVGFYAGMPTVGPPAAATLDDILAMGMAGDYSYLVVDERYTTALIPALKPLLDPDTAPRGLRLVTSNVSPYAGARVVIYEIDRPKK